MTTKTQLQNAQKAARGGRRGNPQDPRTASQPEAIRMTPEILDRMLAHFLGWTVGDGSSTEGYAVEHYYDPQTGAYLGPDEHGIEPIFDDDAPDVSE